jgi:hypothetical protein
MPETLDIVIHLPSGWALIALIIAACTGVAGLLMFALTPLAVDDNGGWE